MKNRTTVERKSERELVVTRTINGPARIVFEAWTKPELFKQWWVPKSAGLTLLSCDMDVRVGGKYRLVFAHAPEPSFTSALSWTPSNRSLPFTLVSASAFQRTFQYQVTAATTSRTYSLSGISLRDLAGNEATVTSAPLPVGLPVDTIAPVIGAITVDVGHAALNLPATSPPRINGASGRVLAISTTVTEANPAPTTYRVTVGSIDVSSSCTNSGSGNTRTLSCSYTMTGNETSGQRTITIRVADTSGNVTTDEIVLTGRRSEKGDDVLAHQPRDYHSTGPQIDQVKVASMVTTIPGRNARGAWASALPAGVGGNADQHGDERAIVTHMIDDRRS